MNTRIKYLLICFLAMLAISGCHPNDYLDKDAPGVLSEEDVFSDPALVRSNMADLYNRIRMFNYLGQESDGGTRYDYYTFCEFPYVFPSNAADKKWVQNLSTVEYGRWFYWDYGYLHAINQFLNRIKKSDQLDSSVRRRFTGEAHFLRAYFYMKEVKRMGGVPILKDTLKYNFSGNAEYLYHKRDPEYKVYNFIISEADSAAQMLPKDPTIKSRATWGTSMALKAKAALFAGSIAQHGQTTPSVTLPNNIVGIPADMADDYYQTALDADQEIIDSGEYHLYNKFPDDPVKNYKQMIFDKQNNPEVMFVKDHKLTDASRVSFVSFDQPRSNTEEAARSGIINPSLNFVQSYEKLDNTFSTLQNKNADGSYKTFDNIGDIFKSRDYRLAATIMLPGSSYRGDQLDFLAGYYLPQQDEFISGTDFAATKTLPGQSTPTKVVGLDGPGDALFNGAVSGFYLRKYMDPTTGAGTIGTGSDEWWVRFRYGEVLLDAAEAAFQLGQTGKAKTWINKIRERAGFPTDLQESDITFDRIVHERLKELAFEGHRIWDFKRWRLAHKIWNGGQTDLEHPSDPTQPSTNPWGIWPYKIYDPGKPDNGKWIYKRHLSSIVHQPELFRLGNYYTRITNGVLGNNPKLIQNPNVN